MEMIKKTQTNPALVNINMQIDQAIRHLMSEQNRDPYAPAYGCFDRRYWGWKLIDFPEATFQRNVYPLAWRLKHPLAGESETEQLTSAIQAGLTYSVQIQHKDGSFDQAFPNERSYGATAFLLHPLIESYKAVKNDVPIEDQERIEDSLQRAAIFLCEKSETHGLISNHLAGAALSLQVAGELFANTLYLEGCQKIVDSIVKNQSQEGWFQEYDGADPGYQTLGIYYLAQIFRFSHDPALKEALGRAVDFISWFVHPDGSFAGEYGSRRTAIYYPGGIALLADVFPMAAAITRRMLTSISDGHTITLGDIDMGNIAPLLQSTILAADAVEGTELSAEIELPCDRSEVEKDFVEAGISIRGTKRYYAIIGIANGGVARVFRKTDGRLIYDDAGYVGLLPNGRYISTQMTDPKRGFQAKDTSIKIEAQFYEMLRSLPTPGRFVLLRIMNLTIMRSIWLGNLLKKILVNLLIQGKKRYPLMLYRQINFQKETLEISDTIVMQRKIDIEQLTFGIPFSSIHMASSRYYQEQFRDNMIQPHPINVEELQKTGEITRRIRI
jgi:hypothetical protein